MGCSQSAVEKQCSTAVVPKPVEKRLSNMSAAVAIDLAGPTFHSEYKLCKKLGKGAYATVYLATRMSDWEQVAVKVIDIRPSGSVDYFQGAADAKKLSAAQREVLMAAAVVGKQPIVSLLSAYLANTNVAYLIFERCDQTFLQVLERMPQLTETSLKKSFQDMHRGVQVVHSVFVAHRDIKPDNFLQCATSNTIKLTDFGLASSSREPLTGVYGTPPFMAPEMLRGERYDERVDVWSLGVIMFTLLYGKFPYKPVQANGTAMKAAILAGEPAPIFHPSPGVQSTDREVVSQEVSDYMRLLLTRDPSQRPTASEALLSSYWSRKGSEDEVSLRPMLFSAKRAGAFDVRLTGRRQGKTDMDLHLEALQKAAHHTNDASNDDIY